jgi:hypothetical protein
MNTETALPIPELSSEPALRKVGFWTRTGHLIAFAFGRRGVQIAVAIVAVTAVAAFGLAGSDYLKWPADLSAFLDANEGRPTNWVTLFDRLQSAFAAFTLLVAFYVWFGELGQQWEDQLPARMTVLFLREGNPAIVCRYAWLAAPDDLRAWAQQVAGQAVGERFLEFSPDVASQPAEIMRPPEGQPCRYYEIRFQLSGPKAALDKIPPGQCCYQNLLQGWQSGRSAPAAAVARLPQVARWL